MRVQEGCDGDYYYLHGNYLSLFRTQTGRKRVGTTPWIGVGWLVCTMEKLHAVYEIVRRYLSLKMLHAFFDMRSLNHDLMTLVSTPINLY